MISMSSIKRVGSQAIDSQMLKELTEIKKSVKETERLEFLQKTAPQQAQNSPYFPDRLFSNPLAVQGNPEETKWKEVPTYEDQRDLNLEFQESPEMLIVVNNKKLNII